jgi:hypothetical protein
MDMTKVTALVGLMVALSVASERLVEIIKGYVPWLDLKKNETDHSDKARKKEGQRRSALQLIAVASGVITASLAWTAISSVVQRPDLTYGSPETWFWIVGLGVLASGGSGFWNAVLTYFVNLKDLKEQTVKATEELRKQVAAGVSNQVTQDILQGIKADGSAEKLGREIKKRLDQIAAQP